MYICTVPQLDCQIWRAGCDDVCGSQFTSSLWSALCSLLGIQHVQTTAYHPEGNGMVECFNRHLKDTLRDHCTGSDWGDHLPWVMLGLRADTREDTANSPSQAVFCSAVCLPGQFSPGSELELTDFLNSMRATLSRAETVPSKCTIQRESTIV